MACGVKGRKFYAMAGWTQTAVGERYWGHTCLDWVCDLAGFRVVPLQTVHVEYEDWLRWQTEKKITQTAIYNLLSFSVPHYFYWTLNLYKDHLWPRAKLGFVWRTGNVSYIGVICMQCVWFLFIYVITQCYFWKKSMTIRTLQRKPSIFSNKVWSMSSLRLSMLLSRL